MSGLEIPGFLFGVAGALPVFHGCLKLYDQIQDYRQFDKILRTFRRSLSVQQALFKLYTRLLLQGITEDNQLAALLKDLDDPQWDDHNWNEHLRNHLGPDFFESCTGIFGLVRETLEEIPRVAHDDSQSLNNPKETLSWCNRFIKRCRKAKFVARSRKQTLEGILDKLRHYNTDLCRLVDQKYEIGLSSLMPKKKHQSIDFLALKPIQDTSKDLLKILSAIQCDCHTPTLQLQIARINEAPAKVSEVNQGAMVRNSIPTINLHFVLLPNTGSARLSLRYNQFVIRSQGKSQGEGVTGAMSDFGEMVKSLEDIVGSKNSHAAKDGTEEELRRKRLKVPTGSCQLLSGEGRTYHLSSIKNPTYQHFLKDTTNITTMSTHQTLKRILSEKSQRNLLVELCMQDRLEIAAALALSVLQLHKAPWLQRNWRSRNILFFTGLQKDLGLSPYLSVPSLLHISAPEEQKMVEGGNNIPGLPRPSNRQVYGLGLILLELGIGKTLEESAIGQAMVAMVAMSPEKKEYMMAQELIVDLGRYMGADYAHVVRTCLGCDFDATDADLEQEKMQEEYFMKVINQLDSLVHNFTKRGL